MSNAAADASPTRGNVAPWLDRPEIDPPNMLYFGADPCHTPARERYALSDPARGLYRPRKLPGSNIGRVIVPETCQDCGGRLAEESGDDPMGDSELVVRVCRACMRATGREKDRAVGAIHTPDAKRLGRAATKVKARPDPALNAYLARARMAEDASGGTAPAKFRPRAKAKAKAGQA